MDFADQAQAAETVHRQAALASARARNESQILEDGRVVCRDCGESIPAARLAACPGACRCVACQEEVDAGC